MEKIGVNSWCNILRFLDLESLLSFGATCQFAYKLVSEPIYRDEIISKMEIPRINFTDHTKKKIADSEPLRIPQGTNNILIYKSYHYPGNRYRCTVTHGFFKGTKTRYYYEHAPGRCENYWLRICNDGDKKVQELFFNVSSHGTVFLEYTIDDHCARFVAGGPCDNPDDWEAALGILKRVLTLSGLQTDMSSWIEFANPLGICDYYTVFFHPQGAQLDKMIGDTYNIYTWLESMKSSS